MSAGAGAQELPSGLPMAKAAMAGDAKAQHRIGYYYHTGQHLDKDLAQAAIWYKKAAEQDLVKAQYAYGRVMAFEKEGPKDYAAALPWFIKASKARPTSQGYGYETSLQSAKDALDWYCKSGGTAFPKTHEFAHKAQCLYARGKKFYAGSKKYKIQRDFKAAWDYLTRAAQGGERKAYVTLAKMHSFGYSTPRNEAEAQRLLRLAGQDSFKEEDFIASDRLALQAQQGDKQAHRRLAARYLNGKKYKYDAKSAMIHLFLSQRARFVKGANANLIWPILRDNNPALLAGAHQDALNYARDYNWPEKDFKAVTKSYKNALKDQDWLVRRGGNIPSKSERRFYNMLYMVISLFILKGFFMIALFLIRQWRIYTDRPRRANPFN